MISIFLLLNLFVNILSQQPRYFYIYEWDKALDDVWPPPGATLHQKSGYSHDFYDNHGSGKLLDADVGLFQTWQFSLYKVFN